MPSNAPKEPWQDPSLGSERESDSAHGRRKERDAKRAGRSGGDEDAAPEE